MGIMNKTKKYLRIFLSGITVLFLCATLSSDFLEGLQSKFNSYQEKYPLVKVKLSFNQPAYSPEDTLYFSAWYLYEDLKVVKGNHVVSLDIISGEGKTVQSIRFKVLDGRGYNQVALNSNLNPGIYKLIAYTDWMKNFGQQHFFQRDISIVSKKQMMKSNKKKEGIEFYAEGGHLVQGVENHIVAIGQPASEIVIKDENGAEIVKATLNSVGMGSVTFTPVENKKYVGFSMGERDQWALPSGEGDGVVIQLDQTSPLNIKLSIPEKSKWTSREVYAILVSDGKILLKQEVKFDQTNSYRLDIPRQLKSEGYIQMFIVDSNGVELAQRVFVIPDNNRNSVKLKMQSQARQRESFTLGVGIVDDSNNLIESDLSVAVFQSNLFNTISNESDFYLSDLPGVVEWVNNHKEAYKTQLNNFLISKKWERIQWESILKGEKIQILYPFQNQIKLKGKVQSIADNSPAPDSTHVISFLQGNAIGYDAYTKNGSFEIPLYFDFWGDDRVFYTAQIKNKSIDNSYRISMTGDTLDLTDRWGSSELLENSPYGDYALKRNLIAKSYSFFQTPSNAGALIKSTNQILEEEFQGADQSINVTEFIVFPTMEDLLREVVTFVQFRKKRDEPTLRLFYRLERSVVFYKADPLYIIDGVMSTSTSLFLSIKPEDLISVKVINNPNKLAQLGKLGENGVLFVESKKGDLHRGFSRHIFPITGLSRPANFTGANYLLKDTDQSKPDLRSTLYWNPSIKSDAKNYNEITFFTSDDVGPMKILVQGITKDGRVFVSDQLFNVELNPDRK